MSSNTTQNLSIVNFVFPAQPPTIDQLAQSRALLQTRIRQGTKTGIASGICLAIAMIAIAVSIFIGKSVYGDALPPFLDALWTPYSIIGLIGFGFAVASFSLMLVYGYFSGAHDTLADFEPMPMSECLVIAQLLKYPSVAEYCELVAQQGRTLTVGEHDLILQWSWLAGFVESIDKTQSLRAADQLGFSAGYPAQKHANG